MGIMFRGLIWHQWLKRETMNKETTVLPPPKKRYEWIDNARIVAALLIIYVHLGDFFLQPNVHNPTADHLVHFIVYEGRVPFFLILAGYFLGRKITWHKAFDRAVWLLIPYVLWNVLYYCYYIVNYHQDFHLSGLWRALGMYSILGLNFPGLPYDGPIIWPSWFLRDIVILSLLTPFIVRFRKAVIFGLIACLACDFFHISAYTGFLKAANTCFYYFLGTCLCDFRIDDAYRLLNKRFTPYVVMGLLFAIFLSLFQTLRGHTPFAATLLGELFGALMIAQSGVLIETHLPKLSQKLAPCGPACFLVFMLHVPILHILTKKLPCWYIECWLIWLLPFPVTAFIIAMFLLMKKYTPWLMPYLGHMKIPKSPRDPRKTGLTPRPE